MDKKEYERKMRVRRLKKWQEAQKANKSQQKSSFESQMFIPSYRQGRPREVDTYLN